MGENKPTRSSWSRKENDAKPTSKGHGTSNTTTSSSSRDVKSDRPHPQGRSDASLSAGVDKGLEEVRQVREDNEARAQSHGRTVVLHEVQVNGKDGKGKRPVELSAVGGRAFLNSHGEAVFDQDGLIEFRQKLDEVFQAVS